MHLPTFLGIERGRRFCELMNNCKKNDPGVPALHVGYFSLRFGLILKTALSTWRTTLAVVLPIIM